MYENYNKITNFIFSKNFQNLYSKQLKFYQKSKNFNLNFYTYKNLITLKFYKKKNLNKYFKNLF
jgi:hypothetical protein